MTTQASIKTDAAPTRAVDAVIELLERVQTYLDALYDGDVELFKTVLHPTVRLHSGTAEKLVVMDRNDYLDVVAGRPSPRARGDQRARMPPRPLRTKDIRRRFGLHT
jgi:Putative lumazine-binding